MGRWIRKYPPLLFVEEFDYHESFSYIKLPLNKEMVLTVN